jgi:WD40 repeat protein
MKYCLSGAQDGIIEAWNFKPQSQPFEYLGHKAPVHQIIYHPNGKFIASCSSDDTVIIWTNSYNYQKEIIKSH